MLLVLFKKYLCDLDTVTFTTVYFLNYQRSNPIQGGGGGE